MSNNLPEKETIISDKFPLKITAFYLLFSIIWIIASDRMLATLVLDGDSLTVLQSFKGLFFLFVTGITLYIIIRRSISALRQSQLELQVREELFRTVQDASLEGFLLFGAVRGEDGIISDFELIYCNPQASRLLGLNVEEMLGRRLSDLIPDIGELHLLEHYISVMEKGKSWCFEHGLYRQKESRWFKNMVVKSGDGIAICLSDITESKHAEEELRQERDFTQSIVNNARTIIVVWALDGTITLFNRYAEELTGYTAEEIIGKRWTDILVPEEGRSQMHKFIKEFQKGEVTSNGESQWVSKAGNRIDVLWNHAMAHDEAGKPIAFISMGIDITDRKKAEATINHMAYHDSLTNLPNRALFNDRLRLALSHARRNKQLLAVMYIDLDRFKLINDTLGHAMGDKVLIDVAARLKGCLRGGDTVARIGGDEFLLIFPAVVKEQDAPKIALKIINALKTPFIVDNHEFHLTTSIGISLYPHDGEDAETLVKNADSALYRAKEQGNTYQLYTPSMNEKAQERLDLERDLCKALEQEEFVVYYQPQVNITLQQVTGMEALVRWKHPERGLIMPGDFIFVAEETGLIVPIGEWVMRAACFQNKAWQDAGYPPLRVVVNLSARQFLQQDLVEMVARILDETKLAPQWLELEITEGVIMKDLDYTVKTLRELRKMGVHIAIDDFGTGYSSLNYLKKYPINTLKIDQSFIRGVVNSEEDAAIVTTIIVLSQNLNIKAIAEGVETEEQFRFLKNRHCCEMQGFLFSEPLPGEDFEKLLKDQRLMSKFG